MYLLFIDIIFAVCFRLCPKVVLEMLLIYFYYIVNHLLFSTCSDKYICLNVLVCVFALFPKYRVLC